MPPSRDYSDQDIAKAIAGIKDGLSYRDVFDLYNVPVSTLVRKMKQANYSKQVCGEGSALSEAEENYLVYWLKHCQDAGFPRQDGALISEVQKILKSDGRPTKFKDGKPGRKWLRLFFGRHPELSHRMPETLQKQRENVTEDTFDLTPLKLCVP